MSFSAEVRTEWDLNISLALDRIENPSLMIPVCYHLASLVMPNADTLDGFFYPTLTLMMDPYNYFRYFLI